MSRVYCAIHRGGGMVVLVTFAELWNEQNKRRCSDQDFPRTIWGEN